MMTETESPHFNRELHTKFFLKHLEMCPYQYTSTDTTRTTLLYFVLSGLDILGTLDSALPLNRKHEIIEWIYQQQVTPVNTEGNSVKKCGFRGGSFPGPKNHAYNVANIASTYSCLLSLLILGDDLSKVDAISLIQALKYLQTERGGFRPTADSTEEDMRFVFCAVAISFILNDFTGINLESCVKFIKESLSYDGAFGGFPNQESHGGYNYCALGSLSLLDCYLSSPNVPQNLSTRELLSKVQSLREGARSRNVTWCLNRQNVGFQGRINKPDDTCYSWWIGASLVMLDSYEFTSVEHLVSFLLQAQTKYGGFGKVIGAFPDLLHSYLSVAALSLIQNNHRNIPQEILQNVDNFQLQRIVPELNVSLRVYEQLEKRYK
ncbi:terpenoid cyclases/protein prenyltransferase alpha-alpha toroid [Paraphysoderma sedebokerense]|nr:terpenoid cyclases/protein prenyltransferase alpha-alpha toroid [Paraphysoderma sedebokerense]